VSFENKIFLGIYILKQYDDQMGINHKCYARTVTLTSYSASTCFSSGPTAQAKRHDIPLKYKLHISQLNIHNRTIILFKKALVLSILQIIEFYSRPILQFRLQPKYMTLRRVTTQ
jgi:hypothetical protein